VVVDQKQSKCRVGDGQGCQGFLLGRRRYRRRAHCLSPGTL